jgi:hypothetical protein
LENILLKKPTFYYLGYAELLDSAVGSRDPYFFSSAKRPYLVAGFYIGSSSSSI